MADQEDLLQDRLARYEAGEGLEACQQEMPQEGRALLSLVDRLGKVEWPERDHSAVIAQRKMVLESYTKESQMQTQAPRSKWYQDWRLPVALSAGFVALIVCGIFSLLAMGSLFFIGRQVVLTKEEAVTEATGDDLPVADQALASLSPNQVLLIDSRGLVEIQDGNAWSLVQGDVILSESSQIRTGALSSARLLLKDGSAIQLGPQSEISLDQLESDPERAERTVVLTQWLGSSEHILTKLQGESRYEVQTPSARGLASGTQFHVRVNAERTSWYVTEGEVEVLGGESSVRVGAGEMTNVNLNADPEPPTYFITGQGEVTYIGESWVIAGQSYLTHEATIIIGNPQVGDIVFFEGHIQDDQTRVLDVIVLIRRNPLNTFTMSGEVDAIGDSVWTINGQIVAVTDITEIEDGIDVGDLVWVEGVVLEGGSLQAEVIRLLEGIPGKPFDFTGVVQQTGDETWLISGVTISIDQETKIEEGLIPGDLVRVQGWIREDGTWLAGSIERVLDETSTFEFSGHIESMDPWVVAGISFETREWTEIDEGLSTGDLVRVKGQILVDGTWVASEIRRYDQTLTTILIGRVYSMDPWVVGGVQLNVDEDTQIVGDITIGMLVRVEMLLLPDGSHRVIRIEPVEGFAWEFGCQELVATVISIDGDQIHLEGWPNLPLDDEVQIEGDLKPGSVVQILICFDEDMNVKVVYIIIIQQPELPPTEEPPVDADRGHKVMICHKPNGKNPHTIVVASAAIPAHLGHGDYLGACR